MPPPVPADKYKAPDGLDVGIRAGTVTPTPTDVPAQAVWTAPTSAKVGVPVRLDGSGSTGNAPLTCTWTFENQSASVVYETIGGCMLSKTFTSAGTKYVRLTVRDADGDTNARRRSFTVRA